MMYLLIMIWDHPRLRGEYSSRFPVLTCFWGSPPLARGVHTDFETGEVVTRITPACAGSTTPFSLSNAAFKDHPRLRGEYCKTRLVWERYSGSPPLARGVLVHCRIISEWCRITPACAGSTLFFSKREDDNKDHPRLRGEYIFRLFRLVTIQGSPPLARGVQSG